MGFVCVILWTATMTLGCGKGGGQGGAESERMPAQLAMEDIRELINAHVAAKKRPPRNLDDLGEFEPANPVGFASVQRGESIVFWGLAISGGNAIVAHEKNAPSSGGFVLLQDGTVKKLTAVEFQAAPKVKK
jgi:hypothetical protein